MFHGTRTCDPKIIYDGTDEGFDFRMCAGGMYGRGTYFHDMASYSRNFGYNAGNGVIQFFVAKVLIGNCIPVPPSSYVVPPDLPGSNKVRYDSIRSNNAIGKNEYIIFNN